MKNQDYETKGKLARVYRDGKGVEKDLDKAIELMREAASGELKWPKNELLELLMKRQTESDYSEIIALAPKYVEEGSSHAAIILSNLYLQDNNTFFNYSNALYWARKAFLSDNTLFKNYFELLINSNEQQHMDEAKVVVSVATSFSKESYGFLARMYRDGKGVEKDLDKAIELMSIASSGIQKWPKNELAELLVKRGTQEDFSKALEINLELSATGDLSATGRLARMYRDGKGVEKDLDKAIELMKKAAESELSWPKKELSEMLAMRGDSEDLGALLQL